MFALVKGPPFVQLWINKGSIIKIKSTIDKMKQREFTC